jgi:RNA polymerase sigma-70 factor (ECF subfamily)
MPAETDPAVLARFVQGDAAAFEALFRRFEKDVYGWVLRIVRDTGVAEDVVIEAFWRAYRGCARFDPSREFGAWMRRIATNAAIDALHRRKRELPSDDQDPARVAAPPAADRITEALAAAFRRLPAKLRVVAVLVLVEERSLADVADALDLPVGTVKSRVFRATRALRKELAAQGIRP